MMNVEIKTVVVGDEGCADIIICIDGTEEICESIGGEPEDNTYFRDYSWIVPSIKAICEKLGANVTTEVIFK